MKLVGDVNRSLIGNQAGKEIFDNLGLKILQGASPLERTCFWAASGTSLRSSPRL